MPEALKLVISDFHLGKGQFLPSGLPNVMEDFHHDIKLSEFLEYYSRGAGRNGAVNVELVINGDFFDYLTVDVSGKYPDAMFESDALMSTKLICEGHPVAMQGLRDFAHTKGCAIRYLLGNHDPAIVWPSVQNYLRDVIHPEMEFGMDGYDFDDIRIEHGHQREVVHQFDMHQLTLPPGKRGRKESIINFPFGCFFVTQFLTKLRIHRPYISYVMPFRLYLRWAFINDFWFALWHGILVILYFIKMRFIRHPYRFSRFSKTLQILHAIFDPPRLESIAAKILKTAPYRILIMGHNHEACMRLYPDGKQYINSGTWTEFTSFDPEMLGHHSVLSFILVERDLNMPWRAELKRWIGKHRVEETLAW